MIGNGIGAGANALRAIASITVESLPPEKSRHGRAISAATSRKMKMLSASRLRRLLRTWDFTGRGTSRAVCSDLGLDEGPKVSSRRARRRCMTFDLPLAFGGLLVGIIVGLTGMGGGALMTPMLVFFFGADPLTAISSALVASFVMKPAGALVHLRAKTVNRGLVGLLCIGSVPAAFIGAWSVSQLPRGDDLNSTLKVLLGLALLVAAFGLVLRALYQMWQNALPLGEGAAKPSRPEVVLRP